VQLPYEGSISLAEEEAGGSRYLGQNINLYHASRPDWENMAAQTQQESISLVSGETQIRVGPPEHLAPQDHAELHRAARDAQQARAQSAGGPQTPLSSVFSPPN